MQGLLYKKAFERRWVSRELITPELIENKTRIINKKNY